MITVYQSPPLTWATNQSLQHPQQPSAASPSAGDPQPPYGTPLPSYYYARDQELRFPVNSLYGAQAVAPKSSHPLNPKTWSRRKKTIVSAVISLVLLAIIGGAVGGTQANKTYTCQCDDGSGLPTEPYACDANGREVVGEGIDWGPQNQLVVREAQLWHHGNPYNVTSPFAKSYISGVRLSVNWQTD